MKKAALIFALAVFVPALILGGLALRAASSQRLVLERQQAELRQQEAEAVATLVRAAIAAEQQVFVETVQRLAAQRDPAELARDFNRVLPQAWRPGAVGFAVTVDGRILSPAEGTDDTEARQFLEHNAGFLGNRLSAQVYQADPGVLGKIAPAFKGREERYAAQEPTALREKTMRSESRAAPSSATMAGSSMERKREAVADSAPAPMTAPLAAEAWEGQADVAQEQSRLSNMSVAPLRKVAPQQQVARQDALPPSRLNLEESRFQGIVSEGREGILARFVQDELELLFWVRPAAAPDRVFGAQLGPEQLHAWVAPLFESDAARVAGACIALLDDRARPFALSVEGFRAEWKRPFVATEVGEILPHWEVALYLLDPDGIGHSARRFQLTVGALIALALGAILWGGLMVFAETRRQFALVQKKADFVSNVSHELKTPLTSIRMFAEMLHEGRVSDPAKRQDYLRVITLEAGRLTRLINNVLDFARLERNQKRYQKRSLDLHPVLEKLWEAQEMHLQGEGFTTSWRAEPQPYPVEGDEDALAQVIVNLLSNAEKYSTGRREIELESRCDGKTVTVRVLDRGLGVPRGEEERIFESFHRAHDELSSGIQGSGLGLTLARRIAREHGGDVTFRARDGGGSVFTLTLPAVSAPWERRLQSPDGGD